MKITKTFGTNISKIGKICVTLGAAKSKNNIEETASFFESQVQHLGK
jgi:hypothetical protein